MTTKESAAIPTLPARLNELDRLLAGARLTEKHPARQLLYAILHDATPAQVPGPILSDERIEAEARNYALFVRIDSDGLGDYDVTKYECQEDFFNCVRACAALAAVPGQSEPVAPKLHVWYGAMPESNGKSNFTAILHAGDIADGITLDRSEYPDRVRYEADCARHLIGELAERPFILDYDADKRSDYAAQPTPVSGAYHEKSV